MSFTTLLLSYWFPVGAWAGLIFYLSSIPHLNSGLGVWDFVLRKGAHMFEFFVLALLLARASRKTWPQLARMGLAAVAGLGAIVFAASDEYHQSFVPGRGPSLGDIAIDSCGVMLALIVISRWMKIYETN